MSPSPLSRSPDDAAVRDACASLGASAADAKSEVGDTCALRDLGVGEQHRGVSEFAEEADALPEQHGCQVDGDLVNQVEVERLPDDRRTGQRDRLAARGGSVTDPSATVPPWCPPGGRPSPRAAPPPPPGA